MHGTSYPPGRFGPSNSRKTDAFFSHLRIVCAWCQRTLTLADGWQQHPADQSGDVTHGICPDCHERMLGNGDFSTQWAAEQ